MATAGLGGTVGAVEGRAGRAGEAGAVAMGWGAWGAVAERALAADEGGACGAAEVAAGDWAVGQVAGCCTVGEVGISL